MCLIELCCTEGNTNKQEPTIFRGAEARRGGVGELCELSELAQQGGGEDVRRVAGIRISEGCGQVTHCGCGPDTVRVPLLVPANPETDDQSHDMSDGYKLSQTSDEQ